MINSLNLKSSKISFNPIKPQNHQFVPKFLCQLDFSSMGFGNEKCLSDRDAGVHGGYLRQRTTVDLLKVTESFSTFDNCSSILIRPLRFGFPSDNLQA